MKNNIINLLIILRIKIMYKLRYLVLLRKRRLIKNKNFSIISSNCIGTFVYNDFNSKYYSPFVNLFLNAKDFLKYLKNMEYYNSCELKFIRIEGLNYPIGKLDDITVHFMHYKDEEYAHSAWYRRLERLDMNNLFVIFTDRDGCTYDDLLEFDSLPFKNKIVFTHKFYPEIKSSVYLPEYKDCDCIGDCFMYKNWYSVKKIYDRFDFVKWLNQKK